MFRAIKNRITDVFTGWLKNDQSYHVIFWVLFYVFLIVIDQSHDEAFWYTMSKEFVIVVFFALIVYINIHYLIPNYLSTRNYLTYLAVLALTAAILMPIKTSILYLISTGQPVVQAAILQNLLFIFLSSFFIGMSSTIFHIMNDWIRHQREKKELQNQTLQSELKYLKAQINPHFLFNTLNSLYALTLKKSDMAPEIVLRLSEMMRYMLYECNEKEVALEKEVNYIRNYLELEKIRHGESCEITFRVEGNSANKYVAPLMFIPFIENSFKHGLNKQISNAHVNIDMGISKDDVQMAISNSKTHSVPTANRKRSGGIGLVNIKRRLELLYPEKYSLNIKESPNNYLVNLSIQLI